MVEDIPEGEEVLADTFLLFGCPIIILFASRASHDFMSSMCAKRGKLALTIAKPYYMISTPGGRVVAKRIAREVSLELAGQVFPTHLIVLDGQGIDVIVLGRFFDIWHGYPTPPSHSLSQGNDTPHCGKEYSGNTCGTRVSRCLSR
jgi:hypothetical protein